MATVILLIKAPELKLYFFKCPPFYQKSRVSNFKIRSFHFWDPNETSDRLKVLYRSLDHNSLVSRLHFKNFRRNYILKLDFGESQLKLTSTSCGNNIFPVISKFINSRALFRAPSDHFALYMVVTAL